jgi:Ca-activated chloride channel homolog
MTFAAPWMLLGALLLVPLTWLVVRGERARGRSLQALGTMSVRGPGSAAPPSRLRALGHGLALGALTLVVVALARPLVGPAGRVVHHSSGDVLFVLDLSRSMGAVDIEPSRLDAAKRAATTIARALPDDRVGLLVFGGSAFLQLPPTTDHSTFRLFVDAASAGDIPDPATNFEAAADLVAATLGRNDVAPYSAAVLLSDGEDVEGKLEDAIRALAAAHVPTFAVGVGTAAGTLLMDRDAQGALTPHLDWAGREVTTRLAEQNLADIATRTGGRYVRWRDDASVQPIIAELARGRRRAVSGQTQAALADRFQWPLVLAFATLLAEGLLLRGRLGDA